MDENKYQGYKNYATWNVAFWIGNEYDLYHHWQYRAEELKKQAGGFDQVYHGIWTEQEAVRYLLADELKADLADVPPLADSPSMHSDILSNALAHVDWREVADSILDE